MYDAEAAARRPATMAASGPGQMTDKSETRMSDAAPPGQTARPPRVLELNVTGHMMTLETGVFCVVAKRSPAADVASGLPGVRLSLPPGVAGRPDLVKIVSDSGDGWLSGFGDAALVHVRQGPAQVMVTIYQEPGKPDGAPSLQVLQLFDQVPPTLSFGAPPPGVTTVPVPMPAAAAAANEPVQMDMVAHIQGRGDVGALIGDWLGEVGSKRWVEGFAVAPIAGVSPEDIEYQAVLGRGWLSPWAEGGQFCGSRGMALPVLGLKLRLRGKAAEEMECVYSASFIDGTQVGPMAAGETAESESLAPLEAFQVVLRRKGGGVPATRPAPVAPLAKPKVVKPATRLPAKPAAKKAK